MKKLLQVGQRVVEFNDDPITVQGVKHTPTWPWSADYRKCFRKTYGPVRLSNLAILGQEDAYRRWLDERDHEDQGGQDNGN